MHTPLPPLLSRWQNGCFQCLRVDKTRDNQEPEGFQQCGTAGFNWS
jgi:hypothetical protein